MALEERIKQYRKQAGLSQEKMADTIGVSRQAITKWENGTGTPDIANLLAIANLFQITVDELLTEEKKESKNPDFLYESRTEYDIDGRKNFDMKLGGAKLVVLESYEGEKIAVTLLSNVLPDIQKDFKVKIDSIKNRIDVDVVRMNDMSEAKAKEGLVIKILLPAGYLGKVELAVNAEKAELYGIENEVVEITGKIREVLLQDNKSEIEIDSNLDMLLTVCSHEGAIELNQVSATSRILVPEDYSFRAAAKGIATRLYFEENGETTEDFSAEEADNYIELNGLKSELVVARESRK